MTLISFRNRRFNSLPGMPGWAKNDLITLKNNEYKVVYFATINSATGAITIPTGATILLDQFPNGVDAFVSEVDSNGQPTGVFPKTSLGVDVDVATFDALGNYTLTDTPNSFPVALIYVLKIKAIDYNNLVTDNILEDERVDDNDKLLTWSVSKSFTQGQKFIWQSPHGDWRTYIVRSGQTLNAGETPFTNPEKVDKEKPFDNYILKSVSGNLGGAVSANGINGIQNWLYDGDRNKYVVAGGNTSDNIIILQTTISIPDIHTSVNLVSVGHDVQRVVYINNEYWAINTNVAGTVTITRVDAVTNTVISTFTSTYTNTISGNFFRVRNNKLYYATFQSTVTAFQLYEIDAATLVTTTVITAPATSVGYMTWWFDEVNGFICSTTNINNTYRVYDINTFTLLGTYGGATTLANTGGQLECIYASDGNTYIVLPQSSTYGLAIYQIDPTTGQPTISGYVAYIAPAPNNTWKFLYDSSNPDYVFIQSTGNVSGVVYFLNIFSREMIPIQTPYYYGTVSLNTQTNYNYKNKQLEMYYYVSTAGISTVRQIIKMDFR